MFRKPVLPCRFLISKHLPLFGVSPDGFSITADGLRLVEIKCPKDGRTMSAQEMITANPTIKLFDTERLKEGCLVLKRNHKYNGQIQLSLAVTGLAICELIIFSSFDNTFEIILVKRDDEFIRNLIIKLIPLYFANIFQFVTTNYNFLPESLLPSSVA